MNVHVEFLAQARTAARCDRVTVELSPPCTAADAIRAAVAAVDAPDLAVLIFDSDHHLHRWLMVSVNNQAVLHAESTELAADSILTVMPPISGG